MFYTKDKGITATKAELSAVLQFTSDSAGCDGVGFRVECGSLNVHATNGASAVYHRGEAFDGKGGRYDGEHQWQLSAAMVARIVKSMTTKDEAILCVSDGKLTRALIQRETGDGDPCIWELHGHVSEQLSIGALSGAPERPSRSAPHIGQFSLEPSLLTTVAKVAKACGGGASRWSLPADDRSPVYIEVDDLWRLADDCEPASWVVVVMPMRLGEIAEGADAVTPHRVEAERILREQDKQAVKTKDIGRELRKKLIDVAGPGGKVSVSSNGGPFVEVTEDGDLPAEDAK